MLDGWRESLNERLPGFNPYVNVCEWKGKCKITRYFKVKVGRLGDEIWGHEERKESRMTAGWMERW